MKVDDYRKSANYILSQLPVNKIDAAIILGSSLGRIADRLNDCVKINYVDIPNFLACTVESHEGKLIGGYIYNKYVLVFSGRFHYYEGYSYEDLSVPIRVLQYLGVNKLLLTNAAGGVNPNYKVGDIMVMKDHINLMGASPTRGRHYPEFGQRFFDLSYIYDAKYRTLALNCARKINCRIHEGIYFYTTGPHFETPAEVNVIRLLGGDVVGMSTVTEVITAAQCGIKVLGLSLITNMAAGILDQPITGDEVTNTAERAIDYMGELIAEIIKEV